MIPDEDAPYYSEEEHIDARTKEKPVGPPLELEIPLRPPPSESDKVYLQFSEFMIKINVEVKLHLVHP